MSSSHTEERERLHWDVVSNDYLEHRPGYPGQFFELLHHLGVGLPQQDILDLGAGTGALAVPFAKRGARVTAVDLSEGQLQAGREAARRNGVEIEFKVAPAEETNLPSHSFDVITASMCWGYFDVDRMALEVPRLLRANGLLLLASLVWIGQEDDIARETDKLIFKYNPRFQEQGRGGRSKIVPEWSKGRFSLKSYHEYKVDLPFNRESWRGRMRATKWIGAALPAPQLEAFDREHTNLLDQIAPENFKIRHQIRIQILEPEN